jgi:hypothetical protein
MWEGFTNQLKALRKIPSYLEEEVLAVDCL